MHIPEFLYRPQARDLADAGYGVFTFTDEQSGLVSSITHVATIPSGYNLLLMTALVETQVGAGQTGTHRLLLLRDRGTSLARVILSFEGTDVAGGQTNILNFTLGQGPIWIPSAYDVAVQNVFDAGVNSNLSDCHLYGLVIPRGSMRG